MKNLLHFLLFVSMIYFVILFSKYGYLHFYRKVPISEIDKAFDKQGLFFRM